MNHLDFMLNALVAILGAREEEEEEEEGANQISASYYQNALFLH